MVKEVVDESEDNYSYKFSSDENDSLKLQSNSIGIEVENNKRPRINSGCMSSPRGLKESLLHTTDRESSLYDYNMREKKLLTRVIKYMSPAKKNQIWESIFIDGLAGH